MRCVCVILLSLKITCIYNYCVYQHPSANLGGIKINGNIKHFFRNNAFVSYTCITHVWAKFYYALRHCGLTHSEYQNGK